MVNREVKNILSGILCLFTVVFFLVFRNQIIQDKKENIDKKNKLDDMKAIDNLIFALDYVDREESKLFKDNIGFQKMCEKINLMIDHLKLLYRNVIKIDQPYENITCFNDMKLEDLSKQLDGSSNLVKSNQDFLLKLLKNIKNDTYLHDDYLNLISFWLISYGWTIDTFEVMFNDSKEIVFQFFKKNNPITIGYFMSVKERNVKSESKDIAISLVNMAEMNQLNPRETKITSTTLAKLLLYQIAKTNHIREL